MVKVSVTTDNANIALNIPESYVGKQLEVFIYAVDEVESNPNPAAEEFFTDKKKLLAIPTKPSEFRQILSHERVQQYLEYIEKSRAEWQQRI